MQSQAQIDARQGQATHFMSYTLASCQTWATSCKAMSKCFPNLTSLFCATISLLNMFAIAASSPSQESMPSFKENLELATTHPDNPSESSVTQSQKGPTLYENDEQQRKSETDSSSSSITENAISSSVPLLDPITAPLQQKVIKSLHEYIVLGLYSGMCTTTCSSLAMWLAIILAGWRGIYRRSSICDKLPSLKVLPDF